MKNFQIGKAKMRITLHLMFHKTSSFGFGFLIEYFYSNEFTNPESVSSATTCSTTVKPFEFHITTEQRRILQYQLTAVTIYYFIIVFFIHFVIIVYSIVDSIYFIKT